MKAFRRLSLIQSESRAALAIESLESEVESWKQRYSNVEQAVDALEQAGLHTKNPHFGHRNPHSVQIERAGLVQKNPHSSTYTSLLQWCAQEKALSQVKRIHNLAADAGLVQGSFVGNYLLQAYRRCGTADLARSVFDGIHNKDLYSWTIMLAAYAQSGHKREALDFFRNMELNGWRPSKVTYVSLLSAITSPDLLRQGRAIIRRIEYAALSSENVVLGTAIVTMYGKCGSLEEAKTVFEKMPKRNLITWTTLITAYAQHGYGHQAIDLYHRMQEDGFTPDFVTYISVLDACTSCGALEQGRNIHKSAVSRRVDSNVVLTNALVNMYGKCGAVEEARSVFDSAEIKNLNLWNCMLTIYSHYNRGEDVMELYERMDVEPDHVTFLSMVNSCSSLDSLMDIHRRLDESHVTPNDALLHSLMNMYSRFGQLHKVAEIFDGMETHNVISWTAVIAGYAQHGHMESTVFSFREMQLQGVTPDSIAFTSIFFSCNHGGLLKTCMGFYSSMVRDYGIVPRIEHYTCLVDVLGRSGKLAEAEEFVHGLKINAAVLWVTILSACKTHKDVKRAKRVAERVFELEPRNKPAYVMLSNILTEAGDMDDSLAVKQRMDQLEV